MASSPLFRSVTHLYFIKLNGIQVPFAGETECTRVTDKMKRLSPYFGIDVSKKKLDICWLRDINKNKVKTKVFANDAEGCQALWEWMMTQTDGAADQSIVILEATGVYHERITYFLADKAMEVRLAQPQQFHHFAASFGVRSKTDRRDSVLLSRYGAQGYGRSWQPESEAVRHLKALLSRLEALGQDIRREENRLEKAEISAVSERVNESIRSVLVMLAEERKCIEKEVDEHIDRYPDLKRDEALLKTIPGIGPVVSRYLLSIFHSRSFEKASACAAYLGLVPVVKESGSSVRGRASLSKAGNGQVRAKLYMSAIVAIQYNADAMALYTRLLKKGKAKMSALGAVMRKLVHICFGVIKHQKAYCPQVA